MDKTFVSSMNEAFHDFLENNGNALCAGLGINDPKRIFGSTEGLLERFGSKRVFDIPNSENAITGILIGAAITGNCVVLNHQRADFAFLTMDQLINAAAKWHFMFGGEMHVPIVIRLIVGRGWGQGPTHSQSPQATFAHYPGLKVVMPSRVETAKALFKESYLDPNPVIFLEHRWLHNLPLRGAEVTTVDMGKAEVIKEGEAITIISFSLMVYTALRAASELEKT